MTSNNKNTDNPSEQSRAEQSRAEQSRAEQSRYFELNRRFRHLRIFTLFLAVFILLEAIGAGFCGYKLYNIVQKNFTTLSQYQERINTLDVRLDELIPSLDDEAKAFIDNCDDSHYNILFIGNSITRHPITDYWWSDKRGMAASSLTSDYVHVVEKTLSDKLGKNNGDNGKVLKPNVNTVNSYAFNYSIWETQSHDRAETYPVMDKYLTKGDALDVVVVQLGENVSDAGNVDSTYCSDYKALLEHIKRSAPNSKIITVGDFWQDDIKDSVKKSVAGDEDVLYVDLGAIQDDPVYEAGMGTGVFGDDGAKHIIQHSGVADHPGDKGMEWIGKAVVKAIEE